MSFRRIFSLKYQKFYLSAAVIASGAAIAKQYDNDTFDRLKQFDILKPALAKFAETKPITGNEKSEKYLPPNNKLPTRKELLEKLKTEEFDILIIGGGATGCGVALDAISRGLKVGLVEKGDFSSATSSKSTKLIHGGIRYLQNAVYNLDLVELKLVIEALRERKEMVESVPYLTQPLPILLPTYSWWEAIYYWGGIKAYDLVSGTNFFRSSYYLSKTKSLDQFPVLKSDNFWGSIIYYDGQQDDSRMNLTIALSAIDKGAVLLNYVEVADLKEIDETSSTPYGLSSTKVKVNLKDNLTQETFEIKAKSIINATGPFTDSIRQMYDLKKTEICQGSSGTHLVIPNYFSPDQFGLLDPNTSDGRVLFMLPWKGYTLAGTTDRKCDITHVPTPTEEDIYFIINELNKYLNDNAKIEISDVLSAWTGIRPLVVDPTRADTSTISRTHVIETFGKMVTIAGGKWTIYRTMAKDAVDSAVREFDLKETVTYPELSKFFATDTWDNSFFIYLIHKYKIPEDIARHLSSSYGTAALNILELDSKPKRIHPDFPYTEQELRYCCNNEYTCTATDFFARRIRLSFLDAKATKESLPKIIQIMSQEFKWSKERQKNEMEQSIDFLNKQMGLSIIEKHSKE